jgi:aspartate kinase
MVGIVKSNEGQQPRIVLSAFKGITDRLLSEANSAKNGKFDIKGIESKHHDLMADLSSSWRKQTEPQVNRLLSELSDDLKQVCNLGDLTASALDRILAYGEVLATQISAGYLAEEGLKGVPLAGIEAGILTNSDFGNATILDESYDLVRKRLAGVRMPIVAGFFGTDKTGRIATLGRGASDYVATFLAAALRCKTVLFKDVDGVLTADPKIVPNARLIPNLEYPIAIEIARYGSKVLFEKAIVPAMIAKLPIEVRRFGGESSGTLVSAEGVGEAISCLKGMSIFQVPGTQSPDETGSVLKALTEAYAGDRVAVAFGSRSGMSVTTNGDPNDIASRIAGNVGGANVKVRKGFSLVTLVGRRFRLSQVSVALQNAHIEPAAVFAMPSGTAMCAVPHEEDTDPAIRAIHEEVLGRQDMCRGADYRQARFTKIEVARGGFERTAEGSAPVSALRVSRGVSVMSPPGCT